MVKALMDLVAPPRDFAVYPGRVVSDQDPDKRGRVQVRVEPIYGDPLSEDDVIPDNRLPWARVNCLVGGVGTGADWTPPVKSEVLVAAWAGDWERPIVIGAYHPALADDGDQRIPEHVSSYDGGPKTRVVRTEGGQLFEMRWKKGEERIVIQTKAGTIIRLEDSTEEQGVYLDITTPKKFHFRLDEVNMNATLETPGQRHVILDDKAQYAEMATPTRKVRLDDTAQTVTVSDPANSLTMIPGVVTLNTPGVANVIAGGAANVTAGGLATVTGAGGAVVGGGSGPTGSALTLGAGGAPSTQTSGGLMTSTFTGFALYIFLGALTYAITGAWIVTVTGLASITSVGIASLLGSAVVLGTVAGVKQPLLNALAAAVYNGHTHPVTVSAFGLSTTGPPNQPMTAAHQTTDTTAS